MKQKLTKAQEKWVCALEKGKVGNRKVTKGTNELNPSEGKYCCLGVAELTLGKKIVRGVVLKSKSIRALGLKSSIGYINSAYRGRFKYYKSLATLNDHSGITHKGIAKLIRKYPEAVFLP
jgi:hypothetical protein